MALLLAAAAAPLVLIWSDAPGPYIPGVAAVLAIVAVVLWL